MIKITIQAGTNTYLVASKTIGVDGVGIFQGRLLNEVVLSRRFSKAGNAPVTLNVSIRNNDGFIPRSVNLWAASVTIVSNSGHQWSGKITAYDRDGAGILRLVITEKAAPELTIQFPDEVARLVTVDEKFHVSALNVTLPLVVGGNAEKPILVKGILIDKVRGIYLLCVGENHQIVNVYRGAEKLTTGFSAYTGTSGQAEYAGFAYVELTDAALRKNDDGSYVEVSADVIGLKLGSHTVEECRNGARFLRYLLTTPKDGACGWGLGIGSSEVDTAAFSEAIARVDAAGLKMDGVFYFRQLAQSWIDQICQAIRGSYEIGENGLRHLFVNADSVSAKTYTKKNMKLLRDGKGAFTGQVYNRGRLDFAYNPLTGQFMQHVDYEDDTGSIADIGELDFSGQSYLIRDMVTAQAILDYTCKRSLIGADKVYFKTRELPANARTGTIITIDYPEKALSGTWQIISIDVGSFVHEIEAEKFSSSIFIAGTPGAAIDWSGDAPVVSPVLPGAASGLALSTDVEYDANGDGSAIPYISGTFTIPEGKYLGAAVFWGEGAAPLAWNSVTIKGTEFKIKPVRAGVQYTVKVQMFNQSGSAAAITGSIVVGSHAAIPPTPTIASFTGLGCIVIGIAISAFSALSHFEIQRQKSDGSGLTTIASEYRGTSFTDDDATILADYENLYQYRVRSVSRSGRTSAWTSFTTAISATQLRNKDVSADQFIGKHFTTACNVGAAQNGVMFNAQGLQAWCNGVKTVDIPVSGNPTFSGTITASAGNIGGWAICQNCLVGLNGNVILGKIGSYGTGLWLYSGASSYLTTQIGRDCIYDGNSWICHTGIVVRNSVGLVTFRATSCTTANSGDCGILAGWGFDQSKITRLAADGSIFWIGNTSAGGNQAQIYIGTCSGSNGISIGENPFVGSYGTNKIGINIRSNNTNIFTVCSDCSGGNLLAQIAGWGFNSTQLYSSGCGLILNASGAIQTGDFVTGNKGWKIDSVGNAEFNNLCARGAIKTAVFIKDEISVVGGCTMIRPAGTAKNSYDPPADTYSLYLNDEVNQFALNDIIRIKDGVNDYWGRICACSCIAGTGCYITFIKCSGARFPYEKGQAIVNYGSCLGCGGIMLNGQCPYIDLYTHAGLPWNGTDSRVRIGNLNGWGSFATNTYGIAAGCPIGQYMTYDSVSGALNIKGVINIMPGSEVPAGLINNHAITGSLNGYTYANGLVSTTKDGKTILAHRVTSAGDSFIYGPVFKVDPTQAYKITLSVCDNCACGSRYFGIYAYDCNGALVQVTPIYPSNGNCGTPDSNHYFWSGDATGAWRDMEGYVLPHNVNPADVPAGKNVSYQFIMPANTACIRIRYLNYYNAGTTTTADFYSPSVIPVTTEGLRKVYKGLDANGTLISRVAPASVAAPSGSGLYLGSDYMGFYNGSVWKTYMDNTGNFYLGGSAAGCGLAWDATSNCLSVCGCVSSACGTIGGWTMVPGCIYSSGITIRANQAIFTVNGSQLAMHGQWYDCGSWVCGWGFSASATNARAHFLVGTPTSTFTLPSGTSATSGCPIFWVGSSTSYMQFYNGVLCVSGNISASSGNVGGWSIAENCIYGISGNVILGKYSIYGTGLAISSGASPYLVTQIMRDCIYDGSAWICHSGIVVRNSAGAVVFRSTFCSTANSGDCSMIAGWTFGTNYMQSVIAGCGSIYLCPGAYTMFVGACTASSLLGYTNLGRMYYNGAYLNAVGFSVGLCGPSLPVAIGVATLGTVALPSGTTVAATCPFFYIGSGSTNYIEYYNGALIVKGAVCATSGSFTGTLTSTSGNIGQLCIDSCGLGYYVYVPGVNRTIMNLDLTRLYLEHASSTYAGSTIALCALCSGTDASCAPLKILLNGSTSCFAFCTNGRIQVQGTVYPSDRNLKTDFEIVSVLPMLRNSPIMKWRYKGSRDYQFGPVSQDFNPAFKLVHDWETNLTVSNLDGIALRGVQELDECVAYNNRRIIDLESRNACLETRLNCLESELMRLKLAA